jgi:hypothetical protein
MPANKYTPAQIRKAREILDLEDAVADERVRRERKQAGQKAQREARRKKLEKQRAEQAITLEEEVDRKTGGSIWSIRSPIGWLMLAPVFLIVRVLLDENDLTRICAASDDPSRTRRLPQIVLHFIQCDPNVPIVLLVISGVSLLSWLVLRERGRVREAIRAERQ